MGKWNESLRTAILLGGLGLMLSEAWALEVTGPDVICVDESKTFTTDVPSPVTWLSSDSSKASVDQMGAVMGKAPSSSLNDITITATNTVDCVGATKKITVPRVEVTKASIREHQFVVKLGPTGLSGKFFLKMRNSADEKEVELKKVETQVAADVTVELDDVIEKLKNSDLEFFDSAIAMWKFKKTECKAKPKMLDVPKVQVLSKWKITGYFTPTWAGTWNGQTRTKGVYPANQFPQGLKNVDFKTSFLNSQDPQNEGLAVDGSVVTRPQVQPKIAGFPQYEFLPPSNDKGYIENPDRDQHTAGGCPPILDIRATTVAVRKDNPNLKCADEVYIPMFHVRTVDDHGGLQGDNKRIDVWMGQGDQVVKNKANQVNGKHTVLKIISN